MAVTAIRPKSKNHITKIFERIKGYTRPNVVRWEPANLTLERQSGFV
jgi:hypothetical protein